MWIILTYLYSYSCVYIFTGMFTYVYLFLVYICIMSCECIHPVVTPGMVTETAPREHPAVSPAGQGTAQSEDREDRPGRTGPEALRPLLAEGFPGCPRHTQPLRAEVQGAEAAEGTPGKHRDRIPPSWDETGRPCEQVTRYLRKTSTGRHTRGSRA